MANEKTNAPSNYGGMEPGESNARAVRNDDVMANNQAQELVDAGEAEPGPSVDAAGDALKAPKTSRARKSAAPKAKAAKGKRK